MRIRIKGKTPIAITGEIKEIKPSHLEKKNEIDLFYLNGLGDIIYTHFKTIHLINQGFEINIKTTDSWPQRSHQILGALEGIKSFEYLPGFNHKKYILKNIDDIFNPPKNVLFNGIPVLHINSFLENNKHIEEFMPKFPCCYDIKLKTNDQSKEWAKRKISENKQNLLLYCSSYRNNLNCNVHPDPNFWLDLTLLIQNWKEFEDLKIFVVGASYDNDLTSDVFNSMKAKGIKCELLIDHNFLDLIELIRSIDFVITYESGFGMISDVLKTPCLEIFRCQGGTRSDKLFPYLGPINPENIEKTFFPIFYDDDLNAVKKKLDSF